MKPCETVSQLSYVAKNPECICIRDFCLSVLNLFTSALPPSPFKDNRFRLSSVEKLLNIESGFLISHSSALSVTEIIL